MNSYRRSGFVAAFFYLQLLAIPTVRQTEGRELRPSDHGLTYQETPASSTTENSAELSSFFGRGATVSNVPLPEARNMSDPAWWSNGGGGGGGGGGRTRVDHAKAVLLVASLVCGIAGVVLLAVAAFVFLFRFQKRKALVPTPPPSVDK
ncbi:hypothetical protein RJ640_018003 [Escallonia rubra]|uniref:Uncharacterized protein n=1 Tax=Escallonia rubra TaxID=112253 RepID=A0AA88UR33_9ASTE|nr:hypothetical protein RJ640_018003 [Escallonia rubra]